MKYLGNELIIDALKTLVTCMTLKVEGLTGTMTHINKHAILHVFVADEEKNIIKKNYNRRNNQNGKVQELNSTNTRKNFINTLNGYDEFLRSE